MNNNKVPRYISFTPENLQAMKISTQKSIYFYRDNALHHFAVARFGENKWRYYIMFTHSHIYGAKASGLRIPRFHEPLGSDQATARSEAIRLFSIYDPLKLRKKRGVANVFHSKGDADKSTRALFENNRIRNRTGGDPDPRYEPLMSVLMDAYAQASVGKGAERHGLGRDFLDQDMISITDVTGLNGPMYQAIKKLLEGRHLSADRARAEYLGAIVYIAGMIAWIDNKNATV